MPGATVIVFCLPQHRGLLPAELDSASQPALGRFRSGRFPDGELWLELGDPVTGRDCVVLGSLAPPDEQALLTSLLADTLRRAGARRVLALLPHIGYARQDRSPPGHSLGMAWAGAPLVAAGVDRIVTVDIHSAAAAAAVALPVTSLSPAPLFAAELRREGLDDLSLIAPDEGARARCAAVAEAAGIATPPVYLRKERAPGGVVHRTIVGEVARRAVIVDDILDTGATLLSCCVELHRAGVREITVMVTHATLGGSGWRKLPSAGVRRIVATDSVPGVSARAGATIDVLPIGPLLLAALAGAPPAAHA